MSTESQIATWSFDPFDTLFFRESRPHGALGGSELRSLFPPPARTLSGAIRFVMGERQGVDWRAFGQKQGQVGDLHLNHEIGLGDDMGQLELSGPWLSRRRADGHWERLYPAPAMLMAAAGPGTSQEASSRTLHRVVVGPAVESDLGRVRLPRAPAGVGVRARSLEHTWLTRSGLESVLQGGLPAVGEVVDLSELLRGEPRLGIARNKQARTPIEGLLYQTRHLRPPQDLRVEVDLEGVHPRLLEPLRVVRLGGEGRIATIQRTEGHPFPKPPQVESAHGLALCLLTPADLGGSWLPGAPSQGEVTPGPKTWLRRVEGVDLEVHCAVLGKPGREGGWDLAERKPRPVQSLAPAGSVWYCTPRGSLEDAIQKLHGAQVGDPKSRPLGRGRLAVALWKQSENQEGERSSS